MDKNIACVILAAGKGERMKSQLPKVLHTICGRPMLEYVFDLVRASRIKEVVTVLGYGRKEVQKVLRADIKVAVQKRMLGTADAVKTAQGALKSFKGSLLVLYGDIPLLKKETIVKLCRYHTDNKLDATLLTSTIENPKGYGRILRDKYSGVCGIVEEKDANDYQKDIKEINTGIICFNKEKLYSVLGKVKAENRKKEYYLTDVIGIFYNKGYLMDAVRIADADEAMGINSRKELAKANKIMQRRINESLMDSGVSIADPETAFISYGTKIGQDTTIYPFTVIERDVKIGKRCSVGPFARLRPGTRLDDDVAVGNFLEIVRSRIKPHTRARHFGYLGDSRIGRHVNIGAGTVTANYDGKKKNITVIKDNAFIGSDTVLIAPSKIGMGAKTGAGSVVVGNSRVPKEATVVGVPARLLNKTKK